MNLTRALAVVVSAWIPCAAFAASHSWLGGSGPFWTVSANWTNGTPSPGDDLYFVAGNLSNQSNYNSFPSGTAFGKITISEGNNVGYTLAGDRIMLTNGISASGTLLSIQPQIDFDITIGANQTWTSTRGLALNGTVDFTSRELTLNNTGSISFNGLLNSSDPLGNESIIKTNTGFLIFGPNSRLHAAGVFQYPLLVRGGTVRFDGVATNDAGSVTILAQSFYSPVTVEGTGSIDAIEIGGATISPGDGVPGILRCDYIDLEGTLLIRINGTNVGTDYSQLVTKGAELVSSEPCIYGAVAALNVQLGYTPQIGDSFLIVNGFCDGFFLGYPPNSILQANGCAFDVSYGSAGATLTAVRTPDSAFSLWCGSTNFEERTWSSPNSWANGAVPTNGTRLQFTPYQYRDERSAACGEEVTPPPQTNDLAAGLTIPSMLFTATNYTIYGNSVTITEGITNRSSFGTNSCLFDLVTTGSTAFVVDTGSVLVLGGRFNGAGTLHKQGGGELRLTGTTQNSFAGSVSVDDGSVRVDGSFLDGSFAVTTGTLSGSGSVSAVTVSSGTLSPGTGPGVLQVQGNLTMNSGSVLQVELNGSIPGSGYDQLQVNGAVNINGVTLDLHPTNNIAPGTAFLVLINDGADAIVGTFAGLPEGAMFAADGQYFSITYTGGTGNDVVITRLNPPATFSSISQSASNAVQLSGTGGSNLNYTIQATTNLTTKNWVNIGTAPVDGTGHFSYTDTNLLLYPQRFFRALAP